MSQFSVGKEVNCAVHTHDCQINSKTVLQMRTSLEEDVEVPYLQENTDSTFGHCSETGQTQHSECSEFVVCEEQVKGGQNFCRCFVHTLVRSLARIAAAAHRCWHN